MMKRFIAVILSLALLCSLVPAAFAASDKAIQAAQALYDLGLFQGTGSNADGTPNFDLDRTPTRAEAVTMLVRLLGKDAEAKAGSWTTPFTDVADWAKPYVGYAYTNGLTTGTSATTFGGEDPINATQYLTFVLRALGYTSGTDFQWDSAWTKSDEIGLTDGSYNANTAAFTRGDVATISNHALSTEVNGKNEQLSKVLGVTQIGPEDMQGVWASINDGESNRSEDYWFFEGNNCIEVSINTYNLPYLVGTTLIYREGTYAINGNDFSFSGIQKVYDQTGTFKPYFEEPMSFNWENKLTSNFDLNGSGFLKKLSDQASIAQANAKKEEAQKTLEAEKKEQNSWIQEGTYRIGSDLPAGNYYAVCTDENSSGYYCIYSNAKQTDIINNDNFDNNTFFQVEDGQYLKLNRCKATLEENVPDSIAKVDDEGNYPAGCYRVGTDIPAGEYKFVATGDTGYYCAFSGMDKQDIVHNDIFKGSTYYETENGQILNVERAKFTLVGAGSSGSSNSAADSSDYNEAGERKWSMSDATDLSKATQKASDATLNAYKACVEALKTPALNTLSYSRAVSEVKTARMYLGDAMRLCKNRAEISFTDGSTMLSNIEAVDELLDTIDDISITSSNVDDYAGTLEDTCHTASQDMVKVMILVSKFMDAFK